MQRWLLALLLACILVSNSSAGIFVIANYTHEDVTFTVAEPGEKPRSHTIPAYHVLPITISGPADLNLPSPGKDSKVRVDLANAYALIPDRASGVRITGLELPGKAPERDTRRELNPPPRNPVKIPVTLLVDDVDPRADELWQAEVRKRFEAAAAIIEKQTGFRFVFAGFDTWVSDRNSKDIMVQLNTFEKNVKVKAGSLAVGFTSQKLDDNQKEFGACSGLGSSHVLIREWKPRGEPERVEVLLRYLAISLGAVNSPDTGSAMRAKLGDGKALHAEYVIRLDPLNVLVLNLLADQRRIGLTQLDAIPALDRVRIVRVYSALLEAFPGDLLAVDYLNVLDKDIARVPDAKGVARVPDAKGVARVPDPKDVARVPDPKDVARVPDLKNPNGGAKKEPVVVAEESKRSDAIRAVVLAITERAKSNAGPGALSGDELTVAYIRTAAAAALKVEEPNRIHAFLLGLGVALDDSDSLRDDPVTTAAVAAVETQAERLERVAVLGNPTLRHRRDLCRRFVIGCGTGELLTPNSAENIAVGHALFDQHRPTGLSFACLSAEFAGIAFSRTLRENPEAIFRRLQSRFSSADIVPETRGLRDGFGPDKFEEEYGGVNDERFKPVILDIRKRIQKLAMQRNEP